MICDKSRPFRALTTVGKRLTNLTRARPNVPRDKGIGVGLCICLLLVCIPTYGIDRERKLADLYHTGWTFKDGAPSEIYALAQTTDGYLWLGTATGLFRFDGIRFELYSPPSGRTFPPRSIASLFAVPDGGLWVGYRYGGVSFLRNGAVIDYGTSDGLPSHTVLAFARDKSGAIWAAVEKGGLARFQGSQWRMVGSDQRFTGEADAVFVDHAGTLWVGTPTRVLYLVNGEHRFQIAARHLRPIVESLAEAPDGRLWMAEGGYGVRPLPLPGKHDTRAGPAVLVGAPAITFGNQGSLWITTAGNGIRRVPYPERLRAPKKRGPSAWQFHDSNLELFTEENGLTGDYVHCVLQDREGNVWFGTSGGLDRFRQSPVTSIALQPISYRGALPIPSLHSFATSALAAGGQGTLWAAGLGPQVLLHLHDGNILAQLRDQPVDCAYRAPNGIVWVATPTSVIRIDHESVDVPDSNRSAMVYRYSRPVPLGNGLVWRQLELPATEGIALSRQSRIRAITQDRSGRLWMSMGSATFRWEGSRWTSLESLGGPKGPATAEYSDSQGRIWFGFTNTIAMLDGDNVRVFSGKDGIRLGAVTSIGGKGTKIWVGGEFGLELFDGSYFHPVVPPDGRVLSGVSGIIIDSDEGLWFSANQGIIHIPQSQSEQLAAGKFNVQTYGSLDGLTSELRGSLSSPSAVETTDGRVWFATTKGVAWINPRSIVRNTVPPSVMIESVVVNGRKYDPSTIARLPARTTNLQISYTATSLAVPERVRFRYMLEGQDKDWQNAGTRREAFYTKLDPGTYRFRVIACNNDGVWNEAGAALAFVVQPAFDQTLTFRILCALVLATVLWLLYLLRLRQATEQIHQRLGARLEERERIARDLHDTLLQSFQGLLLRFQAASNLLPGRAGDAKKKLDEAIKHTSLAIIEGRDAVQGLRSASAVSSDLADAIRMIGDELSLSATETRAPEFEVIVEGTPRPLHPIVRDEIYRIAAEGLRNAFQHAEPDRIEVEIHYDAIRWRMRIRDDGKGLEPGLLEEGGRRGHWGLQGMRERCDIIGGVFEIWSDRGSGTEIELTLPAIIAYEDHSSRRSPHLQEMEQVNDR
jgi:signal transduction histidine kinase/ligand-binding sensor domain-containing protein